MHCGNDVIWRLVCSLMQGLAFVGSNVVTFSDWLVSGCQSEWLARAMAVRSVNDCTLQRGQIFELRFPLWNPPQSTTASHRCAVTAVLLPNDNTLLTQSNLM
jgi:hypothetical protein